MDWSFLIKNRDSILVTTDSRKVTSGSVFVALKGEHFDGNDFVEQAKAQGAQQLPAVLRRHMKTYEDTAWNDN